MLNTTTRVSGYTGHENDQSKTQHDMIHFKSYLPSYSSRVSGNNPRIKLFMELGIINSPQPIISRPRPRMRHSSSYSSQRFNQPKKVLGLADASRLPPSKPQLISHHISHISHHSSHLYKTRNSLDPTRTNTNTNTNPNTNKKHMIGKNTFRRKYPSVDEILRRDISSTSHSKSPIFIEENENDDELFPALPLIKTSQSTDSIQASKLKAMIPKAKSEKNTPRRMKKSKSKSKSKSKHKNKNKKRSKRLPKITSLLTQLSTDSLGSNRSNCSNRSNLSESRRRRSRRNKLSFSGIRSGKNSRSSSKSSNSMADICKTPRPITPSTLSNTHTPTSNCTPPKAIIVHTKTGKSRGRSSSDGLVNVGSDLNLSAEPVTPRAVTSTVNVYCHASKTPPGYNDRQNVKKKQRKQRNQKQKQKQNQNQNQNQNEKKFNYNSSGNPIFVYHSKPQMYEPQTLFHSQPIVIRKQKPRFDTDFRLTISPDFPQSVLISDEEIIQSCDEAPFEMD